VPRYFGTTERHAKHDYLSFVSQGAKKGIESELVGGGLLRSVGTKPLGTKEYRGNTIVKSINQEPPVHRNLSIHISR
jgi:hypothetical protein